VLRLERGRDYVIDLRSASSAVTRRIRDQKRLVMRLADGAVLENEVWGAPARPKPKPAPEPEAADTFAPPAAAPKPDHIPVYDFEAGPASFTLWPEHQVVVPDQNCVPATDGEGLAPKVTGVTDETRWSKSSNRRYHTSSQSTFVLPVLAMAFDGRRSRVETMAEWLARGESAALCVFVLTDRANDNLASSGIYSWGSSSLRAVKNPLVYVAGDDRVLLRSMGSTRWSVHLSPVPSDGPVPVMVMQTAAGTRDMVVLNQERTEVKNAKWIWFTVPVRVPDPKLSFSVRVEKLR
jgi:hypothetical protein